MTEMFERKPVPFASMFPQMDYFEVDSAEAGARYAIWVNLPHGYHQNPDRQYSTIYMPDGNAMAQSSSDLYYLGVADWMDRFEPIIQISIGFTPEEASRTIALRTRDLMPPNEALPPGFDNMDAVIASGLTDREGADLYVHYLRNPAADRFLAFLTEELHPFIARTYRVRPDDLGLFGLSYGGLFATYAALQEKTIFRNIGAGSPGILARDSIVFKLYADAVAQGGVDDRNLHMTVAHREIAESPMYQLLVGQGTVEFMRQARTTPLKGLNLTTELIDKDSHVTVKWPAIHSFLRQFYLRAA